MLRFFRVTSCVIVLLATTLFFPTDGISWGFVAHRDIHRQAVKSLPTEMAPFFIAWADTLVAWSVNPDRRRSSDSLEAPKHYIDIDRYGKYPYRELPRDFEEAVRKFGPKRVDTNGTVPWTVVATLDRLTDAMRRKDRSAILTTASDLGHYIADAHVPLHATENYDGVMTGQKGLHSRWESQIPERFGRSYHLECGPAVFIERPLDDVFEIVLKSAALVDSVLAADREARKGIPAEELTTKREVRGRSITEFIPKYYDRFHVALNGMVERRMVESSRSVGSYWFTAWVNAGRPDLTGLLPQK